VEKGLQPLMPTRSRVVVVSDEGSGRWVASEEVVGLLVH
jgi:hypothetical protein